MSVASPETKVDALRELADQFVHEFSNTNPVISLNEFTAKWLAQHITLAQAVAYERAAQHFYSTFDLDERLYVRHIMDILRSLGGSAPALELALAQARLDEIENHAAHSTRADLCRESARHAREPKNYGPASQPWADRRRRKIRVC